MRPQLNSQLLESVLKSPKTVIPSRENGEEVRLETLRYAQGDRTERFRDDL
jgi:hypothetical protein